METDYNEYNDDFEESTREEKFKYPIKFYHPY